MMDLHKQYFAFNIWDFESARAVLDAAAFLGQDVILQTSTKAYHRIEKKELRFYVTHYAASKGIQAYLHLDHCKDVATIESAIEYGWDSVMIDASDKSLEDNIAITNKVTAIARPAGRIVEAEVGRITGVEEDITVTEAGVAKYEDVKHFLQQTEVDLLAVAIGTAHGLYQGEPNIHYGLLEAIGAHFNIPLVIHGGTGLTDAMFTKLFAHQNVKKINVSTDVKLAYRDGIEESSRCGYLESAGFDPIKVNECIHNHIVEMAIHKLQLCKNEGKR